MKSFFCAVDDLVHVVLGETVQLGEFAGLKPFLHEAIKDLAVAAAVFLPQLDGGGLFQMPQPFLIPHLAKFVFRR